MMRLRTLHVCAAVAACLLVQQSSGQAANYHYRETLSCPDCHVSHASVSHDQAGQAQTFSQSASGNLLAYPTVTELCLHCHDGQPGIPDVAGDDVNNPSETYDGTERAGGRFPSTAESNWKGHDLPAQGSGGPNACTVCHNPHGSTHAFGMVWPYGSGPADLNTSGCNQCHNVSGS